MKPRQLLVQVGGTQPDAGEGNADGRTDPQLWSGAQYGIYGECAY